MKVTLQIVNHEKKKGNKSCTNKYKPRKQEKYLEAELGE
jgi:hypothetical protein